MFAIGSIIWNLVTSKAGKYVLAAGGIAVALWLGYHEMRGRPGL